ncbi:MULTISPECIES: GreA/GreB family elongation factor [Flavobacteriaceae]|jgi:regulator of nucleoside diphosphate kinase|uniref:Nucleoside diphosphate kinase regulator n=1 Tax=Flagellimonas marinaquae TaxID=254955 RepID=A0AA48HE43_9FLAO|nr:MULTISPECIES: GreA/GreB family elongation factor [Allomuricauda]MCA0957594.1 GreA/GreB family elongation factor [Allomuricauda ruestringensis]BDW93520.1 nucleoside diphosphate kinase regulator [Allomuricauda aquimarina]
MKYGSLIIEKKEYVLLKRLINLTGYHKDDTFKRSVGKLREEMESAQILDGEDMPKDVIRFNSWVTITSENGWHKKFKLVMPSKSDVRNNHISILTPMGASVIGYAQGDTYLWEFPSGVQQLTIEHIEQENEPIDINMVI